jgi:hypothetical protein
MAEAAVPEWPDQRAPHAGAAGAQAAPLPGHAAQPAPRRALDGAAAPGARRVPRGAPRRRGRHPGRCGCAPPAGLAGAVLPRVRSAAVSRGAAVGLPRPDVRQRRGPGPRSPDARPLPQQGAPLPLGERAHRHAAPARRGHRLRGAPQGQRRRGAGVLRGRRHQQQRLPRGAQLRGRVACAGGLRLPQQRLRHQPACREADRVGRLRLQGRGLRHPRGAGGRQRRAGGVPRHA